MFTRCEKNLNQIFALSLLSLDEGALPLFYWLQASSNSFPALQPALAREHSVLASKVLFIYVVIEVKIVEIVRCAHC